MIFKAVPVSVGLYTNIDCFILLLHSCSYPDWFVQTHIGWYRPCECCTHMFFLVNNVQPCRCSDPKVFLTVAIGCHYYTHWLPRRRINSSRFTPDGALLSGCHRRTSGGKEAAAQRLTKHGWLVDSWLINCLGWLRTTSHMIRVSHLVQSMCSK